MQQQYGAVAGKMTVTVEGKEYTLQQAAKFLENPNRSTREEVYRKINDRRLADKDTLNTLYDQLIEKRNQEALNAGFPIIVTIVLKNWGALTTKRKLCVSPSGEAARFTPGQYHLPGKEEKLGVDTLRPWDIDAEPAGVKPLQPLESGDELIQRSIDCFARLRPFFGECLKRMQRCGISTWKAVKARPPVDIIVPWPRAERLSFL